MGQCRRVRRGLEICAVLSALFIGASPIGHADDEVTRKNWAAVQWSTFQAPDFDQEKDTMKAVLTSPKGAHDPIDNSLFRIPRNHYFDTPWSAQLQRNKAIPIAKDFSFEANIERALETLEKKKNPTLILSISAHGAEGYFDRSGPDPKDEWTGASDIKYKDMFDVAFKRMEEFEKRTGKKLRTQFYISACDAYSAKAALVERIKDPKGAFHNGTSGLRFSQQIDLFTDASESQLSTGDQSESMKYATQWLNQSQPKQHCDGMAPFSPEFKSLYLNLGYNESSHRVWSSYSAVAPETKAKQVSELVDIIIADHGGADLRWRAVSGLRKLYPHGDEVRADLDRLLSALRKSKRPNEQHSIIQAIGAFGDMAVPDLLHLLRMKNPAASTALREAACRALEAIGPAAKDAAPELVKLIDSGSEVDDEPFVLQYAIEALGAMGPAAAPSSSVLTREAKREGGKDAWAGNLLVDAFVSIGPKADPAAISFLEERTHRFDPAERQQAVQAIGIIGKENMASAEPILRKAMLDPSYLVKTAATQGLALVGSPSYREILEHFRRADGPLDQKDIIKILALEAEYKPIPKNMEMLKKQVDFRIRLNDAIECLSLREGSSDKIKDVAGKIEVFSARAQNQNQDIDLDRMSVMIDAIASLPMSDLKRAGLPYLYEHLHHAQEMITDYYSQYNPDPKISWHRDKLNLRSRTKELVDKIGKLVPSSQKKDASDKDSDD